MAGEPFPRWRAGIRTLVQGGTWRWALALGFAIALGGGAWAYDVFAAQVRALWPQWKAEGQLWLRETLLWIEFLSSITVTLALLCWFTCLVFCLLCALLFEFPGLLDSLSRHLPPREGLSLIRQTVDRVLQRERGWGTVLNVASSLSALALLTAVLKRPLDYWDVGIQVVISTALELIVLQVLFPQGRLEWDSHKP